MYLRLDDRLSTLFFAFLLCKYRKCWFFGPVVVWGVEWVHWDASRLIVGSLESLMSEKRALLKFDLGDAQKKIER